MSETSPSDLVCVADLVDVPEGRGLRVAVNSVPIALFRSGRRVTAVKDACHHMGFPLSRGDVDGGTVVCAMHGWAYDLESGARVDRPGQPLEPLETRIIDDRVFVSMNEQGA